LTTRRFGAQMTLFVCGAAIRTIRLNAAITSGRVLIPIMAEAATGRLVEALAGRRGCADVPN